MCNQCSDDGSPLCETCLVEERMGAEIQRLVDENARMGAEIQRLVDENARMASEPQGKEGAA